MKLQEYPAAIEAAIIEVATINQRVTDYRRGVATLDDGFAFEVIFATNPETGKPLFTNEQQRATAIRDRQRDSDSYQALIKNIDGAEMAKAVASAKLERLRGELSVGKLELRARVLEPDAITE